MASVARNEPCPCGSGKRYKGCHGAFAASLAAGELRSAEPREQVAQLMRDALDLQQQGKLAEAIAKYETVLAVQPGNFDALHMLGVAWFQANQLDRAEDLVGRALAIRPDLAAAQTNRELITEARRLTAMESELCRKVLPKMAALSWTRPLEAPSPERKALDLVIATRIPDEDDLRVIRRIAADQRFRTVAWQTRFTADVPDLAAQTEILRIGSGREPESETMLVYGLDIPAAAWISTRVPAQVALAVNADSPCQLLDRIRELSDQGRAPISVIFTRAELRSASDLPGLLLEEWLAGSRGE